MTVTTLATSQNALKKALVAIYIDLGSWRFMHSPNSLISHHHHTTNYMTNLSLAGKLYCYPKQ
jgi:hypothetical protein